MVRLLIADDHKILRDGLKALLLNEGDIKVIAEAANGEEVIKILSTNVRVDLVLLGVNGNTKESVETTKYIRTHFKKVNVLILTNQDEEESLYELLNAGANGFLVKNTGNDELLFAIRKISNNGFHMCSELVMNILRKNTKYYIDGNGANQQIKLSKREMEVLQLISEGLTNTEISQKLFTSRRTIETHRMKLIDKTKAKNTAELIKFAVKHNLIS